MTGTHWSRWQLCLIIVLTTLPWQRAGAYNRTCTLPTPASGPAPLLPQISPQFTIHVEATFLDKNSTMQFVEYFDYDNNRGKLEQLRSGVTTDYYYNYNTNELLVVNPDDFTCAVQRLSSAGYTFLLGDNNGHIFSPAAALRFSTQTGSPWQYTGKAQVRGINVNQWTNCLDWPSYNTSMQVVWSFVDTLTWTSSVSIVDVPVQCHVTGRVYTDDQHYRTFEHQYEFIHYFQNLPPDADQIFETPSGIQCPGRINTRPLPSLPDAMSFVGESLDEQRKAITYTKERYDYRGGIVTYTFRGYNYFTTKYGNNPLGVVHDFNTGTEYVLDLELGNCTMGPLTSTPDVTKTSGMMTSRLAGAAGMLNLDSNYTYEGQRTIRGMPCDVWITQRPATDILGVPVNSTYEWAFSSPSWSYQYGSSGVSYVPVQVIYTLEDYGSRQTVVTNVYDFVASVPDVFQGLNLDSCFIGLPRNNIVFRVSRVYKTLLDYFETQFKYAIRHSIAEAISISPLRVANVQYTILNTSLTVNFDLLSVPSAHSVVANPVTQVSLDDATSALVDAITYNTLVIQLTLQNGQPQFIVPDPHSVLVTRLNQLQVVTGHANPWPIPTRRVLTPAPRPLPTQGHNYTQPLCAHNTSQGYSAGVMVGSAFALGVVGAAMGYVMHRFLIQRGSR